MSRLRRRRSAPGRNGRRASGSRWLRGVALALPLLLLSACADAPQDSLEPAGEWARKLDVLWDWSFGLAVLVFVVVEGILVFALIRFRNRPDNEEPRQVHGNTPLEIGWTILPALLLAGLAVPTVATIFELAEEPADAVEVEVVGHQWWWEFNYPDLGVTTANELHIPAGDQINVHLASFDVIHSFWVPQLAGKVDVVPGRDNRLTMAADEPGTYLGQCAEFCGLSHANMRIRVIAHTPEGFEQWLAQQREPAAKPAGGPELAGYDLFGSKGCVACHSIEGHEASGGAAVGPDLTHLHDRATFAGAIFELTTENLRRWLEDPSAMKPMQPEEGIGMPAVFPPGPDGQPLSEEEIDQLVAYLETLR